MKGGFASVGPPHIRTWLVALVLVGDLAPVITLIYVLSSRHPAMKGGPVPIGHPHIRTWIFVLVLLADIAAILTLVYVLTRS